ncbi:cation:proton antiporter [Polyangium jinanense]|uniref:Cation:proton antiporter n=1 Tax=Polyangium jinanense TaxID=2829994 RepID=A0A9X4AT14_9BACT|nr:cation:proton antiporter [Polyangium jinanense]MDC3955409.1 cation:proton antiporter [Polyangium jinanense]MDC3981710.1 cation:proton antiporter [Polyangium jinanense]
MHAYDLILTLTGGLLAALLLGMLTQRLGASPILGYLLAGIVVGPRTPGFVANLELASQLAEVGIVLLMFGVGMHFHLADLLKVRRIAVPGAIVQSLIATALGTAVALAFGWSTSAGLVLGMSVAVASTVVLIRMLTDHDALETPHGHVAVGWLIVEDIFTVVILLMVPVLASLRGAHASPLEAAGVIGIGLVKLTALIAIVLVIGPRAVPWFLTRVARSRSRELFTLAVLAVALAVATGSAVIFGASMALGAFLAGMVVGQSKVSHQAAADALPMRDAFAVLFFVTVGMQFDPRSLLAQPGLVLLVLAIILLAKPLAALVVVVVLGYSVRTALTVAIGLAQIGEFSFILADAANKVDLFPAEGRSVLVASAIASIALNPLLFRLMDPLEEWLRGRPTLWRGLNRRAEARGEALREQAPKEPIRACDVRAIVVGYGPVGRTAVDILDRFNVCSVIVELSIDTVTELTHTGRNAVYGDARRAEVLHAAGIETADYLVVTTPNPETRAAVVNVARALQPDLPIFVRAHYISEREALETHRATAVCYEEAEVAVRLAEMLLTEIGVEPEQIEAESLRIRTELRPGATP